MTSFSKRKKLVLAVDLVLIVVFIALDRLTKFLAVERLKERPAIPIIPGVLELNYLENHGAAFGMLQGQKVFWL